MSNVLPFVSKPQIVQAYKDAIMDWCNAPLAIVYAAKKTGVPIETVARVMASTDVDMLWAIEHDYSAPKALRDGTFYRDDPVMTLDIDLEHLVQTDEDFGSY